MKSRMERYTEQNNTGSRVSRYKSSYDDTFDVNDYSNIEGVATIPSSKEVDIKKIKEMVMSRETYKRETKNEFIRSTPTIEEPKIYDIKEALDIAKTNRTDVNDKYANFKDIDLELLKKINKETKTAYKQEVESDELMELINTITNTKMLNDLSDKELVTDMFADLAKTEVISKPTQEDIKHLEDIKKPSKDLDKSFYTAGLVFSKDEFEDIPLEKKEKDGTTILMVILVILFIIACLILGYIFTR